MSHSQVVTYAKQVVISRKNIYRYGRLPTESRIRYIDLHHCWWSWV